MTNTTPAQTDSCPSLEDHLTSLENKYLQERLERVITIPRIQGIRIVGQQIMISSGGPRVPDDLRNELSDPAADAADAGVITVSQHNQLFLKATVVRARRKSDMAQIWIAGAASGDITRDAIDRARQYADTLTAIFGEPAFPVAAGRRITEAQTQYAQSLGVHIIIME